MIMKLATTLPKSRRHRESGFVPYSISLKGIMSGIGSARLFTQPINPLRRNPEYRTTIMLITARDPVTFISFVGGTISTPGIKLNTAMILASPR